MALSFSIPVMRSAVLAAAAVVSMSVSVSAHAYSQLVVFGDSLSDNGNANALMQSSFGVTLPAAPYFNGRCRRARAQWNRLVRAGYIRLGCGAEAKYCLARSWSQRQKKSLCFCAGFFFAQLRPTSH